MWDKISAQCACGAALITRSRDNWLFWMDNHNCPDAEDDSDAGESGENGESDHYVGEARSERSYQWNGQHDGDYRTIPDVNAKGRRPAGFAIE